jgi:hypothetical protein
VFLPSVVDSWFGFWFWLLLYAHKHRSILGAAVPITDTSEPVDGNGDQIMVTVQSEFESATF